MKLACSKKTHLLNFLLLLLNFVFSVTEVSTLQCISNFTLHQINTPEESKSVCARISSDKVTWDDADALCKLTFSHLEHRLYYNSPLHLELVNKGIDLLWIGIRRRANFFVANSSTLFEEKENVWGYFWSAGEPRSSDCVALNVTNGSLLTQKCKSRLPFICENSGISAAYNASFPDLDCPKNWKLSFPLSTTGRKCVSNLNEARSQADAEELCAENQGRLATSQEYDILRSSNYLSVPSKDTAYWVNNEGDNVCVYTFLRAIKDILKNPGKEILTKPENCSKPLQFICIKDFEINNVTVSIKKGSERLNRYTVQIHSGSSACDTEDILICNAKISVEGLPVRVSYQWYKDDIPVSSCMLYVCKISYVSAAMKWDRYHESQVNRQGSYHCEVRLAGLTTSYTSPKVDVFYSDIASYIIDIRGIDLNSFIDYSHHKFEKTMKVFNRTISSVLNDLNFQAPAIWDFQSVSVVDRSAEMKIVVYVNRTSITDFDNVDVYKRMKETFENHESSFNFKGNIFLTVNSADVCFNKEVQSSDTCNGKISWPTTTQATDVVPTTMCMDEYHKPVHRECKGSFTNKAEWSAFNCSLCKEFYERFPDCPFQCSNGYSKFKDRNLCFKIYNEKKNWYEAYKTCSETSSYLLDIYIDDIGPIDSLWLSYKYSHGKIQSFGMKPIKKLGKITVVNPELHCVSAVLETNKYEFKLENCSKEITFVCVQNPYELVSSVKFANTWTKLHVHDSCFYFDESTPYTWMKAVSACKKTFHGAHLLNGIRNIDNYKYLKWLIYQKFNNISCYTMTWWMNFTSVSKNGLATNTRYVDWSPYINLNFEEPRGALTLFPEKKIYWTLAEADSNLKLICEIQNCQDNRPTQAYIEDRTKTEIVSFEDYYTYLKSFKLKCIPSGWFVTSSLQWYKDGISLNTSSDLFSFNLPSDTISLQSALEYQGYYSCSVDQFSPIRTIQSTEHLFKIPGIYTYVLSMVSQDETYITECPNYMLNEKLLTKSSLDECFRNNFEYTFNSFFYLVKNVTCNSASINITVHVHFKEESEEEEDIFKIIQETNFDKFCETCNIQCNITLRSTVACYRETKVLKNANVTWPTTLIGAVAYPEEKCLTDEGKFIERTCLGDFNSGAIWSEMSTDECSNVKSIITEELYQMRSAVFTDSYRSLHALPNLTSSPESLQLADVQLIGQIFENLADQPSLTSENLDIVVETISNLIDAPSEVLNNATVLSNQIVGYFEQMASVVDVEDKDINIITKNVIVDIYPLTSDIDYIPNCILLANGSTTPLVNASVENLQSDNGNLEAGVVLPPNLITENLNASDRVVYAVYKNFNHVKNTKVLSFVIHVALQNVSIYDLGKDEVTLFFKLNQNVENLHSSPKCVFWDYDLNTWSYKGCFPREINKEFVLCVCNHLTSFTIIMEIDKTPISFQHQNVLHFITYIGCSLSCVGFGLIIITFLFFREWRKFLKNKALFNYSISQFLFLLIFMTSIDQTCSKTFCKGAAILSHYFLLSSFAWMIALAYTVYLSLVKVLGTYIPHLMQKFIGFAWGVPAVIIIIVLSSNHEYYSREDYCWLSQDVIVYGIVAPLAFMLAINFFIFGTIVYLNTCKKLCLRINQDRRKLIAARTKAICCTSILLGLSWIFGFLAIGEAKLVFQYLFSITTPLQGFLLAVFFVIRPRSTREQWYKIFSSSSHSSSSHIINSTTISYKAENSRISKYENMMNNVVYRAHSPFTPFT